MIFDQSVGGLVAFGVFEKVRFGAFWFFAKVNAPKKSI